MILCSGAVSNVAFLTLIKLGEVPLEAETVYCGIFIVYILWTRSTTSQRLLVVEESTRIGGVNSSFLRLKCKQLGRDSERNSYFMRGLPPR